MSNSEDKKASLDCRKGYRDNELHQLIGDNQGLENIIKKDNIVESKLQKFKPSKHRKAYRIENNSKKRCYAR